MSGEAVVGGLLFVFVLMAGWVIIKAMMLAVRWLEVLVEDKEGKARRRRPDWDAWAGSDKGEEGAE